MTVHLILEPGKKEFTFGEMNHIIVHEIHHMRLLSVWVRELGITPVSADFVERGLG